MIGYGSRGVARAAYAASAINLAAAVVMLAVLRGGLPAGEPSFAARLEHVHNQALAWRLGWLVWNSAAISLLALFVGLALLWRDRAPLLVRLALLCAAAGLAADLGAESVLAIVSPRASGGDFLLVERIAVALTGYLGNGLYTVAGILLTWAGRRSLSSRLLALAVAVWAAGLALSAATLIGSRAGQYWATAVLMPAFVVWA